jgi:hypothetical protein
MNQARVLIKQDGQGQALPLQSLLLSPHDENRNNGRKLKAPASNGLRSE